MMMRRNILAVPFTVAALMVATMSPALAQTAGTVHPNGCPPDAGYAITSSATHFMPFSGQAFKNGPGPGTVTGTTTSAQTDTVSATATVEASVSGIIASAKASVSGSLTSSVTSTTGISFSHPIPSGVYGILTYGTFGYDVQWEYGHYTATCAYQVTESGSATIPSNSIGWQYTQSAT